MEIKFAGIGDVQILYGSAVGLKYLRKFIRCYKNMRISPLQACGCRC